MTAYYHGGVPGLSVGDCILPRSITGVARSPLGELQSIPTTRSDRVYLSRKPAIAVIWAAAYEGGGGVYEVEPEPPVEPDADWVGPDAGVQAAGARVVCVLDAAGLAAEFFYGASLSDLRAMLVEFDLKWFTKLPIRSAFIHRGRGRADPLANPAVARFLGVGRVA